MKIEKISDRQIRCTLTHDELATRKIKLSELAYGSERTKSLFHEMMQQAAQEFGFEANDIPLMIEAIPASSGAIVLIITKVDENDDIDAKFSRFTNNDEISDHNISVFDKLEGADELLELLDKVKTNKSSTIKNSDFDEPTTTATTVPRIKVFSFTTLDAVIEAANLLEDLYVGINTLYKDESNDIYILAFTQTQHTVHEFNCICNMLSEYGSPESVSGISMAYLEEHCSAILTCDAVQKLNSL